VIRALSDLCFGIQSKSLLSQIPLAFSSFALTGSPGTSGAFFSAASSRGAGHEGAYSTLSSGQPIFEKFVPRAHCSLAHFISGQLATIKLHLQQHAESLMLVWRDQPDNVCGDINTR
jgi:hypothetical protein